MATDTPKRARKPRKNHAKDWQALEAYLRMIIRIKEPDIDDTDSPQHAKNNLAGQLRAYRDILDLMQNGGAK